MIAEFLGEKAKVKLIPLRGKTGNFVVKVDGQDVLSMIGLRRPFPELKGLDMDAVNLDVKKALEK